MVAQRPPVAGAIVMAERLFRCDAVADVDRRAREEMGIPGIVLMEGAGRSLWDTIKDRIRGESLVICAGPGNNGGDALVAARFALIEERQPAPIIITARRNGGALAEQQWAILERMGASRLIWEEEPQRCSDELARARWILEGLLGTGTTGAVREPLLNLIRLINSSPAGVIAVDIPSGVSDGCPAGGETIHADITVCTGPPREVLYSGAIRPRCGEILTVDPGFPPALLRDAAAQEELPVLWRAGTLLRHHARTLAVPRTAHKGVRGAVGVLGGGTGASGAPILAGRGALAGGAGVVKILSGAPSAHPRAVSGDAALMHLSPGETTLRDLIRWSRALVIGPGWTDATTADLAEVLAAAGEGNVPLVLDAAALRLSGDEGVHLKDIALLTAPVVVTPHPGEMASLVGTSVDEVLADPRGVIRAFQETIPVTVVLKGSVTWVAAPAGGAILVLDGGCPALATAGSGDVLAGVVGALLARGTMDGPTAAALAVAAHLKAGRKLFTKRGWFTADRLVNAIAREVSRGQR